MLIRANGPTNLGANRSNPGLPTGRRRDAAGERGRALGHPVARRIEMALGGRFCPTLTWVERWPDPPLRQKILDIQWYLAEGAGVEPARPEGLAALAVRCLAARPTLLRDQGLILALSAGLEPARSQIRNPALFQLSYESMLELRAGLEPALTRFAGAAVTSPVTATILDPGVGLEPTSRRSERRILPLDDPGVKRMANSE